ncbi:hypothetical protein N7466_010144 [Penicillium verhagenii]|uniref:uncharacterized protein n=1 Tax=Penicillium verhagenii TaxID=1562060 RepID=UPI002545466B|nr:uncharacterized protein N7466_010144 [Penicillium verhagenii]KAJ5919201.1 hypothetical protein N7466_010144 [Penicillium verhagenii]
MREYRLPIELTEQVISYLIDPGFDPAPYTTVSREWQLIIEQRTFNTINLNSERLAAFKQIVAQNTQRKTCIRNINLIIDLEPYSIEARAEFETAEEHRRNNELFVPAIQSLFSTLESWPENAYEPGINLSIEALSPSDAMDRQRSRQARRDPTKDLGWRRFERSYLQFSKDHLKCLPVVHAVTALSMGDLHLSRLILPASCALITSKLPRLHRLSLNLSDNEKRDKALRKQNRNDLACHFYLLPSSIKELYLQFTSIRPRNEDSTPANLVDGKIEDPLSSSLRDFSQQLTSMSLIDIVVGKELFWPINSMDVDDMQLPSWPNLTTIYIECGITTPSGEWLFERDPSEDDDFEPNFERDDCLPEHKQRAPEDRVLNSFRVKASPKLMNGLYMSSGRAAQRMPRLKFMSIQTKEARAYHYFKYEVDGTTVDGMTAKATWDAMGVFTPDDTVLQAWRDAAFQHTGVELEVRLTDWANPV